MVEGYARGETYLGTIPATIGWYELATDTGGPLAPLHALQTSDSPVFPAYLCPDCPLIVLRPSVKPSLVNRTPTSEHKRRRRS
jgi:hypothetical protein